MSLKSEYPLEVKVAKALGWTDFIQDKDEDFWWGTPPPSKTIPDPRPCPVPDYPNDPGKAIKVLKSFCSYPRFAMWRVSQDEGGTFHCWIHHKAYEAHSTIAGAVCLAIVEAAGGER